MKTDYTKLKALLAENSARMETVLAECFREDLTGNTGLTDAMQYSLLGGGKRIRAFLVNQVCRMFGGTAPMSEHFAAAIEMVHAYSLIHDDLPAMDNDDFRRGKPSCHKQFGEGRALLAGDTLLTYAFETLGRNEAVSAESVRAATVDLARLAGSLGMAGGQDLDLDGDAADFDGLCRLQSMKTSALIEAACLLGYHAACETADPAVEKALHVYAYNVGIAFQITDDLLDVTGDASLGKPLGSDAKNGKITALSFLSLEQAEAKASVMTDEAVKAVSGLPNASVLIDLARYLLERKN